MDGIQGTGDPTGIQSGDGGDAAGVEQRRRDALEWVEDALIDLKAAFQVTQDADLARAIARAEDWAEREASAQRQSRRQGAHGPHP